MSVNEIVPSASESKRFGRPIARLVLTDEKPHPAELEASMDSSGADVIILRYPAAAVELFAKLACFRNYEPIYADTLVYWHWSRSAGDTTPLPDTTVSTKLVDATQVAENVRTVFQNYQNHYAANPLFNLSDALEGYSQWITDLVADGAGVCMTILDDEHRKAGWLVVDYSVSPPDIRLGGIEPTHRGQGRYPEMIIEAMRMTEERGLHELVISTQVHNVAVISSWARLGWRPTKTVTTVHLVRRGLLR